MAKKKTFDVFVNEITNEFKNTKKNEVFNVTFGETPQTVKSGKGSDTLYLKGVTSLDELSFTKEDRNLVITKNDDGSKIVVEKYFTKSGKATTSSIKKIKLDVQNTLGNLDDPITRDYNIIAESLIDYEGVFKRTKTGLIKGTVFNDTIVGTSKADRIKSGSGDDVLYGGGGNDKLYGGKGADLLIFDTYSKPNPVTGEKEFFGSGADRVYSSNSQDTLQFTTSTVYDLKFTKVKKNLVVTCYDVNDEGKTTKENTVTLVNYFKQKADTRLTKIIALNKWGALEEYSINDFYGTATPLTPETDETTIGQAKYESAQQQSAADAEALANYAQTKQDLADTQATLTETQTELTNTTNTLTETQQTLAQTEQTLQTTQTDLATANQTIATQTTTINELNDDKTDLQNQVDTLTEEKEDLETQVSTLETENQNMKENLVNLVDPTPDESGNYSGSEYNDMFTPTSDNTAITSSGGNDTLVLPEGELEYIRNNGENDLIIKYGEGNQVTLTDYFADGDHSVKKIKQGNLELNLADELTKNLITYITGDGAEVFGTNGNDKVTLSTTPLRLATTDGNDAIYQFLSIPTIIDISQGCGNDTICTGSFYSSANRTYADGSNTILNFTDVGINGLTFIKSYNDLKIQYVSNPSDSITLSGWFTCQSGFIDKIKTIEGEYSITEELKRFVSDTYTGTTGSDYISNYKYHYVNTGNGNDNITNYAANANITGGAGNDTIYQRSNSETVINFSTGDGSDTVYAGGSYGDGTNTTLNFKDVSINDLEFTKSSNNLIITNKNNTSDKVTLYNWFDSRYEDGRINTIKDKNGNICSIMNAIGILGTPSTNADTISIFGDNKEVDSLAGNDSLYIYGSSNTVSGGAGSDKIYLCEGSHNNTLVYSTEDGSDTVYASGTQYTNGSYVTMDGSDTILYFKDKTVNELTFTRSNNDLCITYGGSSDKVTLINWFDIASVYIDNIIDKENKIYNISEKVKELVLYNNGGTSGSDTITLSGRFSSEQNQVVDSKAGSDNIYNYLDNSIINAGEGYDKVYNYGANANISLGKSTGTYSYMYQYSDSPTIVNIELGDGRSSIYTGTCKIYDTTYTYGDGTNTLLNFINIAKEDLKFSSGNDGSLIIQYSSNTNDKVTLEHWYKLDEGYINKIITTDGEYNLTDILPNNITGTTGNDYYFLKYVNDAVVNGLAGNDNIHNYGTNSNITGGAGNDYIYQYSESETVINFTTGDGSDRVWAGHYIDAFKPQGCGNGANTILNFTNVEFDDLFFSKSSNDLKIQYGASSTDSVTLTNWYRNETGNIDKIKTIDGEYSILNNYHEKFATSGDDTIYVHGNNANVTAGTGNDYIYLESDLPSTLNFSVGDGSDYVYVGGTHGSGKDTVLNFNELGINDLKFSFDGSLKITYGSNETDCVTISGWMGSELNKIKTKDGEYNISNRVNKYFIKYEEPEYEYDDKYIYAYGKDSYIDVYMNYEYYYKLYNYSYNSSLNFSKKYSWSDDFWISELRNYGNNNIIDITNINIGELENHGDNVTIYGGNNDGYGICYYNYGNNVTIINEDYECSISNYGTNANITPGKGDDYVSIMENSSAVINFYKGDGADDIRSGNGIYEYGMSFNYGDGINTILKFNDVGLNELTFSNSGSDLKIQYGSNQNDSITIWCWFMTKSGAIDKIVDKNGNELSIKEKVEELDLYSNLIKGTSENDSLCIYMDVPKIVTPGKGDDQIDILADNPTNVIFSSGDGIDVVTANSADNSKHTLSFTDVEVGTMVFGASGNALTIVYGENDSVTLNDWFNSDNYINSVVDSAEVDYSGQLAQLHSDVANWMSTTGSAYATVTDAMNNTDNFDVSELVAIFENFNQG